MTFLGKRAAEGVTHSGAPLPDSRKVQDCCACSPAACLPAPARPQTISLGWWQNSFSCQWHRICPASNFFRLPVIWLTSREAPSWRVTLLLLNYRRGRDRVQGEGSEKQWRCCTSIILLIRVFICSANASSWEAARGNKWVCWIGHQHFTPQSSRAELLPFDAWLIRISSTWLCCQLWTRRYPGHPSGTQRDAVTGPGSKPGCCSFKASCLFSWMTTLTQSLLSISH